MVPAQSVAAGSAITVYAISRDAGNNFIANVTSTWSLVSITGGLVAGDLVAAGDGKSATFTGHVAGTGAIHRAVPYTFWCEARQAAAAAVSPASV